MKKITRIAILLVESEIGPVDLGLDCTCENDVDDFHSKVECMEKALKKHCKEEKLK